jgi:hypothetical protein
MRRTRCSHVEFVGRLAALDSGQRPHARGSFLPRRGESSSTSSASLAKAAKASMQHILDAKSLRPHKVT